MIKKVSIVIVHFNSEKILQTQLSNLNSTNLDIIVVDNSQSLTKKDLPSNIKLISNSYNKGFAVACNQALLAVSNDWVIFLNPDVFINTQEIEKLLNFAQTNSLDAVSPKTSNSDYLKPLPSLFSLLTEFTFLNKIIPKLLFSKSNLTLTGGALLIKKNILENIGGFDERFFLWFEDSDLSKRLYDQNYKVGFLDLEINHLGGYSLKKLTKTAQKDLFFNAMDIYSKKHFNKLSQRIISILKLKYTNKKIIPAVNNDINSIIVPNLKKDLLDNFLNKNKQFFNLNLELIIVTSALDNVLVWEYRKNYPSIKFITLEKNYGFAHTVNVGLRASTGTFIGTINDDVILTKNWDSDLTENFSKDIGSVNPVILNIDKSIESAGIKIDLKGKAYPLTAISKEAIKVVDATNAACVFYNREALIKTGLFDEKFGSYLEDIDLSLRLSKNGYSNIVVNKVFVTHLKHQTSKTISFNKSYHDFQNWILVIIKNWSFKDLVFNFLPILVERGRNISGMIKSRQKANN